ncbi:hypothetical protein [Rugosimonospora africana]|uniref:Uncharacterized protein n=1 Tax=Rugosimonospora africana TaxID=556532 RepID=A0A8J3VWS8_9ACTN|nr:hypothetical protein [Rugosimonospora africana]GIH21161.1 hypothetical protein Raf01_93330 [Rugosimonospora africana]
MNQLERPGPPKDNVVELKNKAEAERHRQGTLIGLEPPLSHHWTEKYDESRHGQDRHGNPQAEE